MVFGNFVKSMQQGKTYFCAGTDLVIIRTFMANEISLVCPASWSLQSESSLWPHLMCFLERDDKGRGRWRLRSMADLSVWARI